ncbi:BQ5605_C004g02685 [Microbotryum silenes-dioicae]|uniref:3-isopropylmalate dehydrogenase n=1 Tax=Microbotryum silenes-dioicae TaxID=796604 RepID=A0A2X0PAW1_9BASI|nr:BQ5605_C004g02685 [Microbotryum silenes-dioicae]
MLEISVLVQPSYNIVSLPGDGIGPEVVAQAERVLETLSTHTDNQFTVKAHDFGGIAIDNHQNPLPESTLQACKDADAILLGAVGGPKWGTHPTLRPEVGLLALRKELGLYANIRPALFPAPSLVSYSPLKEHIAQGTSIVVVRELIGGIYFGDRKEAVAGATEGEDAVARDECSYSVPEIVRITRLAGYLAGLSNPPLAVHSVDKANVLATSRLWRRVVAETMEKEFPNVKVDHQLVDSAAMVICSNPRKLNGIVLTENLFGDILSDETSVIPGSLGLLPSASLGGIPDGTNKIPGMYEPIHGSAPDIAGQEIANPIGTILSVALMCRYSLGLEREAQAIEEAVRIVLDDEDKGGFGYRTKDLGGDKSTPQVGDKVVEVLKGLLQKK